MGGRKARVRVPGPRPGQVKQWRRRDKQHIPVVECFDFKEENKSHKAFDGEGSRKSGNVENTNSESIETRRVKRKRRNKSSNTLKRGIRTEIELDSCGKSNNGSMRNERTRRNRNRNSVDCSLEIADELAEKKYNVKAHEGGLSNRADADGTNNVIAHDIHSESDEKTGKHKKHKRKRKGSVILPATTEGGLSEGADKDGLKNVIAYDTHSELNDLKIIEVPKRGHGKRKKESTGTNEHSLSEGADLDGLENLNAHDIHIESNDLKSIKSRRRGGRRQRRKKNGCIPFEVISHNGLEGQSNLEPLNTDNLMPLVEKETNTATEDLLRTDNLMPLVERETNASTEDSFRADNLMPLVERETNASTEDSFRADNLMPLVDKEANAATEDSLRTNNLMPLVEKETNTATEDSLRSCAVKKLLVLDLNGLLCDVVRGFVDSHRERKRVGKCLVFKRPFCDDFLKFCCERFDIGVWSSRQKINVDGVVNYIMNDIRDKLLFCWDASMCTNTGFTTIGDRRKPLVLKEMKKLWSKEGFNLPWEMGGYSPSNTLLIDDSPYKALCNPPCTAIFPYSYSYGDENDNSLGPGGDIRVYLEGLALADDVQCYVRDHPFGQRAISTENASWKYYERIINQIEISKQKKIQKNKIQKNQIENAPTLSC